MAKSKIKKNSGERLSYYNFCKLCSPPMHLYLKAYLKPLFCDKIQTEKEWFKELEHYMEE